MAHKINLVFARVDNGIDLVDFKSLQTRFQNPWVDAAFENVELLIEKLVEDPIVLKLLFPRDELWRFKQ